MIRLLFALLLGSVAYCIRWWIDEDPFIKDVDRAIAAITIYRAQTACISTDMRTADDWGEGFCD
jgi:hypothetical protein